MAEAHSAVAFSFHVTPEGVAVRYDHDAIKAVWNSGVHSWKMRFIRFKNHVINTMYPSPPMSLFLVTGAFASAQYYSETRLHKDLSYGLLDHLMKLFEGYVSAENCNVVSSVLFGFGAWVSYVIIRRYTLKMILMNHSWMYEPHGKMSLSTKLWVALVTMFKGRHPLLYSYQSALPKLPVPSLASTHKRYLASVRPLNEDSEYERLSSLADEFFKGPLSRKLQRYVVLKSWWATNYVSDWWEEYVYLRGRSPLMVNSNYYGLDAPFMLPTSHQAARAANMITAFLQFKEKIDKETLEPLMVMKSVPLCSQQYERCFNTTRIPGVEQDSLVTAKGCNFIVVYHNGRYFKVYTHVGGKLIPPRHLEQIMQAILDDPSEPSPGEEKLAALTAGDRVPWAKAREQYFMKGVNGVSLSAIEKSSFILVLDTDAQHYDSEDPTKLNNYAQAMLHGKCYDRWFDKTFTLIITANGRVGFNAEHSWADAPIMSQMWEYNFHIDQFVIGYDEEGHSQGTACETLPSTPIRLNWEIPTECQEVIEKSLTQARSIANDVDIHIEVCQSIGKGQIKKCKVSPDAFIQLALQLAYYRDAGKFCLTYEASMTRLFREGRTETVRSCTVESANLAKAVEQKKPMGELKTLMKAAIDRHVKGYRDSMTGRGIDRHLFCLYVVSKYLGAENDFLKEVLSEPWRLSTSQTPHSQMDLVDVEKMPDCVCAGGGFGPVSDDGYGVSYIIAGEHMMFFHVSSKYSCPNTDSLRFANGIVKALHDLKEICMAQ